MYALTATGPLPSSSYLTVAEYLQAPTGVDVSKLVRGDGEANNAEIANLIARASALADNYCNQPLAAAPDTQGGRIVVNREGELRIHPRQVPVVAVTGISYGPTVGQLSPLTSLTGVWVEETTIVVPLGGVGASAVSFTGPLGFTSTRSGRSVYATWSYVSGAPNTTLAATATAGATSITVASSYGIVPGTILTIYDGAFTETVQATTSYSPGTAAVTLATALRYAHNEVGVSVSALGADVKEATILLTSALAKQRGSSALVMQTMRGADGVERKTETAQSSSGGREISLAREILENYRRRW